MRYVRRAALILGVFGVLIPGRTAFAQEKPHNGFAMGYPATAGFLLNLSDRVAVWPELISVTHLSSTIGNSAFGTAATDNTAFGGGVRALLYMAPLQAFRPYVVPQFDYTHTRTSSPSGASASVPSTPTTSSIYSGAVSFGAEYAMSARFGVFGEAGLEYDHGKGTGGIASTQKSIGTRKSVGVIVFF